MMPAGAPEENDGRRDGSDFPSKFHFDRVNSTQGLGKPK